MQMTNEEIVRDYNAAENKNKQIKILADLNTVSPGEIRAILAQAGVKGVEAPKRIIQRKPKPQEPAPEAVPDAAPVSGCEPVYSRIEAILTALPEDASEQAKESAERLVCCLFRDYVARRMGWKGEQYD